MQSVRLERQFDRTFQLVLYAAADEAGAEPLVIRRGDAARRALQPAEVQPLGTPDRLDVPGHLQMAIRPRERAVLCGIGRELVDDHAERCSLVWPQQHRRSAKFDFASPRARIWRDRT